MVIVFSGFQSVHRDFNGHFHGEKKKGLSIAWHPTSRQGIGAGVLASEESRIRGMIEWLMLMVYKCL